MKKIFSVLIITLFASGVLSAQTRISAAQDLIKQIDHKQTYSDIYLDTVSIKKTTEINDYSMIGIHYGMGLSRVMWNPTQKQNILLMPYNVGVPCTLPAPLWRVWSRWQSTRSNWCTLWKRTCSIAKVALLVCVAAVLACKRTI